MCISKSMTVSNEFVRQLITGACHDLPLFSMTKVSRGLFRAIASFARYVTPSAPGSLSISKPQFGTPSGSGSRTPSRSRPVSMVGDNDRTVLSDPITSEPPAMTPHDSLGDLRPPALDMTNLTVSEPEDLHHVVDSPRAMSQPVPPETPKSQSSKTARFESETTASTPETPSRPSIELRPAEPSGDDAGPRFGEDPADQDSKALPGTAGHTGIYRGQNVSLLLIFELIVSHSRII